MRNNYLLDSCVLIELMHGNSNVIKKILEVGIDNCRMSIITYYELFYGAYNAPEKYRDNEIAKVRKVTKQFHIIQLPTSEDFAQYKVSLIKQGNYMGDSDLMIALSAISNKMIMVTNNTRHFNRIKNLITESWK